MSFTPDVIRETKVLIGLERGGLVPVPHVFGYETDPELLGGAFLVMERVRGRVPLARPSIHTTHAGCVSLDVPLRRERRLRPLKLDMISVAGGPTTVHTNTFTLRAIDDASGAQATIVVTITINPPLGMCRSSRTP